MTETTIEKIIKDEGGIIGKDILPIPQRFKWKSIAMVHQETDLKKYSERPSISEAGGAYRFVIDPVSDKYFMIKNNELGYKIGNKIIDTFYNGVPQNMPRWHVSGLMYYNTFMFENALLQKSFETFRKYTSPEANAQRQADKERSTKRENQIRTMTEEHQTKPTSVLDVVRKGHFTSRSFVELKDGMQLIEEDSFSQNTPITVKLPKTSDLEAQYYIFKANDVYMIGDGEKAILTNNIELLHEFKRSHYQLFDTKSPKGHSFYIPSSQPTFLNSKTQQEWEFHLRAANTSRTQIKRAMYRTGLDEETILSQRRQARTNTTEETYEITKPVSWLGEARGILKRLEYAQSAPPDENTASTETTRFRPIDPSSNNAWAFVRHRFFARAA